jgi:cyclophilin family peptidyl-prolyl cis-trans isomerase
MSVYLETTKGDIVIDLFVEDCPRACTNFLKLCKCDPYLAGAHLSACNLHCCGSQLKVAL